MQHAETASEATVLKPYILIRSKLNAPKSFFCGFLEPHADKNPPFIEKTSLFFLRPLTLPDSNQKGYVTASLIIAQ